jgi:hypothetical protein
MRRLLLGVVVLALVVMATGCGSRNVNVTFKSRAISPAKLDKWMGVATKEVVRADLGAPTMGLPAGGGYTQWVYRFTDEEDDDCVEYLLRFDGENVLRDWKRQRCEKGR